MAKTIAGTAAVFDSRSEDLGFYEYIAPGAFDAVLRSKPDVLALWNHDYNQLLGRTASGTVRLHTDNIGLRYEVDLPATNLGGDIGALVDRGDITGSSFGFICGEDDWDVDARGNMTRHVLSVAMLLDVSPVATPAYPGTASGNAKVKAVRGSKPRSAEDAAYFAKVRHFLDAEAAKDRAEDLRRVKDLRDVVKKAGMETAALDARIAEMQTAMRATTTKRTAKRQYAINGKPCTRTQFIAYAKEQGHTGVEQRLGSFGKAERHVANNAEVIAE
jgi:HK97 family phage prohead protease